MSLKKIKIQFLDLIHCGMATELEIDANTRIDDFLKTQMGENVDFSELKIRMNGEIVIGSSIILGKAQIVVLPLVLRGLPHPGYLSEKGIPTNHNYVSVRFLNLEGSGEPTDFEVPKNQLMRDFLFNRIPEIEDIDNWKIRMNGASVDTSAAIKENCRIVVNNGKLRH